VSSDARQKTHRVICIITSHYKTDEVVSVDAHHDNVDYRHLTARFYRAHLQQALLEHVDPSRIHLTKSFLSVVFDNSTRKLVITFTDGTMATADILLGADGIHSAVRRFFVPTSAPRWTGWVTFRSVFPLSCIEHIPDLPDEANHFWGPDRTLFVSKLGKGLFTVVGSYQSDPDAPDAPYKDAIWDSDGDVAVLKEYYKDWSPLTRAIIEATPHLRIYPNTAAQGLDSWLFGDGRATLAGDAAHAHGGAFAIGGSLAINDAWAFAASIMQVFPETATATQLPSDADVTWVLKLYERTRKTHTDRVLRTVQERNKKAVERIGKTETDDELRARMRNRADPTWLHEHDVEATFAEALAAQIRQYKIF
jgi:salicylate hydroxylase